MAIGDLKKIYGGSGGNIMLGEIVPINANDINVTIDGMEFLRSGFITRDFVSYPDVIRSKSFAPSSPNVMTPSVCAYSPALDICVSFPTVVSTGTMSVAVSTDKGETWTNVSPVVSCQVLDCIWDNVNSVFVAVGTNANGAAANCITSSDGYTWVNRTLNARGIQLAQNPVTGTIIAWCYNTSSSVQEFWKSTNGGASWTTLTTPTSVTSSDMQGISYSTIADRFIITQDSSASFPVMVITTADEGSTWDYNPTDFLGSSYFPRRSIVDHPTEGVIYGFTNNTGFYKSTDAITWTYEGARNNSGGNVLYLPSKGIFYSGSAISEDGVNWIGLESISDVRYYVNVDDNFILATEGGTLNNSDVGFSSKYRLTIFDEFIGMPDYAEVGTNNSITANNKAYYVRIK